MMNNWRKLLVSFFVILVIAGMASILTDTDTEWYENLEEPFFMPPDWAFGMAWGIIYLLMPISLYLVWTRGSGELLENALSIFFIQLGVNVLWAILFFQWNLILLSLLNIIFLSILIGITIYYFYKINKVASYLLVPYFIWILIGVAINIGILILN